MNVEHHLQGTPQEHESRELIFEALLENLSDLRMRIYEIEQAISKGRVFDEGMSKDIVHLTKQVERLEKQTASIVDIERWIFNFKWIFGMLAAVGLTLAGYLISLFWRRPDLWPKLVELLK